MVNYPSFEQRIYAFRKGSLFGRLKSNFTLMSILRYLDIVCVRLNLNLKKEN